MNEFFSFFLNPKMSMCFKIIIFFIVFAAGGLKVMDMVKTGAFLNLSCVLIFFLVNISYGELLFGYSGYKYPIELNATTIAPKLFNFEL